MPSSGPRGVEEPAVAWTPGISSESGRTGGGASAPPPRSGEARPKEQVAAEAQAARSELHRDAAQPAVRTGPSPQGRSAALQAFFVANTGRGLMPAGETSGVLSPSLKTEES